MRPGSGAWRRYFRAQYRLLRLIDPAIRMVLRLSAIGNVVELVVRGRRTGVDRPVLVGLLSVGGLWYLGHPNGAAQWTRNLLAAGSAELRIRGRPPVRVVPARLAPGSERDAVIRATARQHPFPGNVVYRLARRHILAVGDYYRLVPTVGEVEAPST